MVRLVHIVLPRVMTEKHRLESGLNSLLFSLLFLLQILVQKRSKELKKWTRLIDTCTDRHVFSPPLNFLICQAGCQ